MTTATEQKQDDRNRTDLHIHRYVQHFNERWAPKDPYDAARFNADLLLLVQALHRDALVPMEQALTRAMRALPPLFPTEPKS